MLAAFAVDGGELCPDAVEEGFGREKVRVPAAVSLQDVELFRGAVFVVAAEGPGAGTFGGVGRSGVKGPLGDS